MPPQYVTTGAAATVTVTDFEAVPLPLQVIVYVFVAVKAPVLFVPLAPNVPRPLFMVQVDAFELAQLSVLDAL